MAALGANLALAHLEVLSDNQHHLDLFIQVILLKKHLIQGLNLRGLNKGVLILRLITIVAAVFPLTAAFTLLFLVCLNILL